MRFLGLLALVGGLIAFQPATAQGISQKVAVCNPSFTNRCIAPDVNGAVPITGTLTPGGTQDINIKQVGGNAVTTTVPVSDGGGSLTVDTLQLPASLGIKTSAASLSVAPSSDGVWPVSQSGTWNITNITGTVSLPTGAATAANQTSPLAPVTAGTATATTSMLTGCRYLTTLDTFANTNQGAVNCDSRGNLRTQMGGNLVTDNDARANSVVYPWDITAASTGFSGTAGHLFNGTTWDRQRDATSTNATTGTGLASAGSLAIYRTTPSTYTDAQYGVNLMDVNGRQVITGDGLVNAANSSTAALGIAGVFTGTSVDISRFTSVTIFAFADQASATNGLSIQQSTDGTNWDVSDTYSVTASTVRPIAVPVFGRFLRIVYTNGGVAQGAFRLQTILHTQMPWSSSVKAQDGLSTENDTQEVTNFNMLKNSAANATADIQRSINGAVVAGTGTSAVSTAPNNASSASIVPVATSAASSLVICSAACNLYDVSIVTAATAGYYYVFNATAAPADGAVTAGVASGNYTDCGPVAATTRFRSTSDIPDRYSVGATLVFSTTACGTLTKSATPVFLKGRGVQ